MEATVDTVDMVAKAAKVAMVATENFKDGDQRSVT